MKAGVQLHLKRIAIKSTVIAALLFASVGFAWFSSSSASESPPVPEQFYNSTVVVIANTQVSLHWHTTSNQFFNLTSNAPTSVPNFNSTLRVTWPANAPGTWNGAGSGWTSTASQVTIRIPSNATAGTTYKLQLYTCDGSSGLCSNAPGGIGYTQVSLVVTANWITTSPWSDFSNLRRIPESAGDPLAVTFAPDNSIWNSSEFSNGVSEVPTPRATSAVSFPDPTNLLAAPFANCMGGPCNPSSWSALSEQITAANGLIWYTEGGWEFDGNATVANRSEVVAFNPSTKNFCTYVVPGNDNEVIGLAVTGTPPNTTVSFTESNLTNGLGSSLDSFNPNLVGDGCPGNMNESYSLQGSLKRIPLPAILPAQVAADADSTIWVTDFWGSQIDRVDPTTAQITTYPLQSKNIFSFFGPLPWQIVTDSSYVYAIDFGDQNLVRINKATGQTDEVAIPVTSDLEQGYGLALSGGKLFFTLAGSPSGGGSTFGYVDIASWEAASASCPQSATDCAPYPTWAIVYKQLPSLSQSGFSGIAVGAGGSVALADPISHQVILLTP